MRPAPKREGVFVVSLDFELYWGVYDSVPLNAYKENLLGARAVIPVLLRLFEQYGIHTTWATVGFLFCDSREELVSSCPLERPNYRNQTLCPYRRLSGIGHDEDDDPFHFGLSLIRAIASFQNQEIATHTFSHYYCLEEGQTALTFRADLDAAIHIAARRGFALKSIVFPRNQCNPAYLQACCERGLIAYRGVDNYWFSEPATAPHKRAMRLLDAYVPVSGHNCHEVKEPVSFRIVDIPASRFLRFESLAHVGELLLLRRILSGISFAAEHGLVYHLWWHPHNFGRKPDDAMAFLKAILDHVVMLRNRHGMVSRNMAEIGQISEETSTCLSA
jgi:hypothetical protein